MDGGGGQSAVWMERSMLACRSTRYHSWSQIPPEILDLVLQNLPHSDCLNLGKVCSSWRSVLLDRRRNSRPPPCILQIPMYGAIPLQLWGLHGDQLVRFLSPKPKLYPKLHLDTWVFHNGQLYVFGINGDILVYTFNPLPQIAIRLPVTSVYDANPGYKRLVVSYGEVLLVLRRDIAAPISPKLHVFREQGGKWVRVKNLGDRVLLIGRYGAESLCTKDLMDSTFEPNCIYYNYYSEFLGKYCMSGQSHQEIPVPRFENKHAAEFHWIVAQVW